MACAVYYTCATIPPEWIAAHGCRPVRFIPRCGADAGSRSAPAGRCPYAQGFAGEVQNEGDADAIVVTTLCDQMRRGAEVLMGQTQKPVFVFNLPSTWRTATAERIYAAELRRLSRFLVQLGGAAPSQAELAATIERYRAERAKLVQRCVGLSARARLEAVDQFQKTGICPDPGAGTSAETRGVPMALLGEAVARAQWWLYDALEQAGGRLVLDATDAGERGWPALGAAAEVAADPLKALAAAYGSGIPHPGRRPDAALHQWLAEQTRAHDIKGMVLIRYIWCDLWHAELPVIREHLGLPVLDLDLGDAGEGRDRIMTRIGAFMEMLA